MNSGLENAYDRQAFLDLVSNLLPTVTRDTRTVTGVSPNFSNIVSLGSSPDLELQIFEVKVSGSLDKRSAIASDAFKLMKSTASYRALVAFYSDDTDQWRFSLVTAQPTIENAKVVTKLSSPKRFSYLLGPKSKLATPSKQLITRGKVSNFGDLSQRFALEVVNNEFYKEIAKLYDELVGTDEHDPSLRYPTSGEASHEFAIRLIGRIIFCWFLREKRSDASVPLIPIEILSRSAAKEENYYHAVLAPLFFEVLNKYLKNREVRFREDYYAQIPYLNGGLFSPDSDDHYKFDKTLQMSVPGLVDVPDRWLRKFFDLLELYNFTVDENTSYDIDLSIDPEMLGRIFENLLARINPETGETVRKSTGSFYTPREIVEYMVDQSLKEYLADRTSLSDEKLSTLISYDLLEDNHSPLNGSERQEVISALSTVKILDPACGSGAFPIGILQKIVFMLQQVDPDSKQWLQKQISGASPELRHHLEEQYQDKNFDYLRKLGVIRESIYGVDIQTIATEISRLRCFLTLIVEQSIKDDSPNRGIEPLPNLDFKFVTANTLVKLGQVKNVYEQAGLFEDQFGINELKELREDFFSSHNSEREALKGRFIQTQNRMLQKMIEHHTHGFADVTRKLSGWDPFSHHSTTWFDAKWMFGVDDDFDIVIANPPYVDSEGMVNSGQSATREYISENYRFAKGNWDIYIAFFERGLDLLGEGGVLVFITPDKWVSKPFGNALREGTIDKIQSILVAGRDVFVTANVDSIITTFSNRCTNSIKIFEYVNQDFVEKNTVDKNIIQPPYMLDFMFSDHLELLIRIGKESNRLGALVVCESACATSDAYKLKPLVKDLSDEFDPAKHLKIINTGTISKYFDRWGIDKMTYLGDKYLRPVVNRDEFIETFPNSYSQKALKTKIIIKGLNLLDGCLDATGAVIPGKTTLLVTSGSYDDLLFALGMLNSKFALFYLRQRYPASSYNQGTTFTKDMINNFPIPQRMSANDKKKVIDHVSAILEMKIGNPEIDASEIEQKINQVVYELYDLTPGEVSIIDSKKRRRDEKSFQEFPAED
jgi:hypothetical protein